MPKFQLFKFSRSNVASGADSGRQEWLTPGNFLQALICFTCGPTTSSKLPQLLFKHGNVDVLIPYALSMLLLVMPLIFVESAMGQYTGSGLPLAWRMAPIWKGAGLASLFALLNVAVYQNYVTTQALYYVFGSSLGSLPWGRCDKRWAKVNCFNVTDERTYREDCMLNRISENCTGEDSQNSVEHFYEIMVLKIGAGDDITELNWILFVFLGIVLIIAFLCLSKLLRSLEKIIDVLTIIPLLLLATLLTTSLLYRGSLGGLCKSLTLDMALLRSPDLWMEVTNLNLYSMGFGLGGIIAVSSHSRFRTNIFRTSLLVQIYGIFTDLLFALFVYASFAGYGLAKNIKIDDLFHYDASLIFVKIPMMLLKWPFNPQLWTFVYFLYFFMLGFRCLLLMVFTLAKGLNECFNLTSIYPKSSVGSVCILIFLLDMLYFTHVGHEFYDRIEALCSGLLVTLVLFLQLTGAFYIYGATNLAADVHFMLNIKVPFLKYYWYLIPGLLVPILTYNFCKWINQISELNQVIFFVEIAIVAVPVLLWLVCLVKHWMVNREKSLKQIFGPDIEWGNRDLNVRRTRNLFKTEQVDDGFTYRQKLYSKRPGEY